MSHRSWVQCPPGPRVCNCAIARVPLLRLLTAQTPRCATSKGCCTGGTMALGSSQLGDQHNQTTPQLLIQLHHNIACVMSCYIEPAPEAASLHVTTVRYTCARISASCTDCLHGMDTDLVDTAADLSDTAYIVYTRPENCQEWQATVTSVKGCHAGQSRSFINGSRKHIIHHCLSNNRILTQSACCQQNTPWNTVRSSAFYIP